MNGLLKFVAWAIALTLVALPIVGVLNGWFASDRWPVTKLSVRAEFDHVNAEQIRAAAQPLLGEGFFAIKLDNVRDSVARLPWVEYTEARKRWPDTIDLVVYEQQPYARWGEDRLVNRHGKIFTVAGTDGLQGLPKLAGPDDRLGDVLVFYADCLRELTGSGLVIDALTLSPRGGWRLDLASGAVIELGHEGSKRRLKRFLDVWPRLAGSHAGSLAYVDLRYENGFAMRWAESLPVAPPPVGLGIRDRGLHIPARDDLRLVTQIPNPQSRIPAPT
ncbi:MAG: cell division protein FtsQ/DivIB [Dokdonella sp.]|uniref:cell division protein FtsQ/DivIB n=1 Tax=Dokdonella sp. TaxID=2291710 RepID=UPI003264DB0F